LKHLETIAGKGRVFDDKTFVGSVRYRIEVYQEQIGVRTLIGGDSTIPGKRRVELHITALSPISSGFTTTQTLRLEDGRKLDFFQTPNGPCASGAIYA
jgi:hypothetical protein